MAPRWSRCRWAARAGELAAAADVRAACRTTAVPPRSSRRICRRRRSPPASGHLNRHFVHFRGRMPGPLVHAQHGLLAGGGAEAEDLAVLGIEPGSLETHAF